MRLARQVLDKEMVDENGKKAGKVDDILLEMPPGEPPIVAALLTGPGSMHPILGSWVETAVRGLRRFLLGTIHDPQPQVVEWSHIRSIDVVVQLDLNRSDAEMMGTERAIWNRWIRHIPFAER